MAKLQPKVKPVQTTRDLLAQLDLASNPDRKGDRRIARTRVALLEAAQRLLATRSIDGISIDEIVFEADVAKGSFYNHFDDKDALANDLFAMIRGHAAEIVQEAVEPDASPAVKLLTGSYVLIKFTCEHPESASAMMRLSPELLSRKAPLNIQAKSIINDGIETGEFSGMPADSATLMVIGVMLVMHQETLGMKWPLKRIIQKMSPMMTGVLKALGMSHEDAEEASRLASERVTSLP